MSALVLGSLVLVSSVAHAQSSAIERWLVTADRAAERGHARQAWRLWTRAAERAPEDGRAAVHLGEALPTDPALAARPTSALRAQAAQVERALDAHVAAASAPSADARRLHAWAIAIGGDHARAVELAEAIAGLQDEPSAMLLRRLATVAVLRGDLASARRALDAAWRALPQESELLSELGAVELALGDPESAMERFRRVLVRHPEDLGARRDLAGALVAAGRASEAVALLTDAVAHHADVPELRVELAYAALEAGQPAVAERAARGAIEALPPRDARGHAALGAALAAEHRREDAEAAFGEALARDPDDLRARQGLDALRADAPDAAP